ncbi:hypothetical protein [Lutimaribacter saemankumensis]|uniref:Sulfotransferase domain-containing protein n=1 Tax=Lutimaribacter saemankumensis TaxID=490829 RepID=A0A1G8R056_9RHOB|nr:hypothetical protein [Lutimaribacter saemankumensis]SDJ10321.1 hypothetical protein SAMN05421850_108168 [Lutimaribacter saemankumensis]
MIRLKESIKQVPPLYNALKTLHSYEKRLALNFTEKAISNFSNYEILVVFGMRRSGNHFIINWILEQVYGSSVFFNNINPEKHPYSAYFSESRIRLMNKSPRIVLSYEDVSEERLMSGPLLKFLSCREKAHGAQVRFALILRDPLNLFASRMQKWPENFECNSDIKAQVKMYLSHVTISKRERMTLDGTPVVPVYYNKMLFDHNERRDVARKLGINIGDKGMDAVAKYGHGSSFDGVDKTAAALRSDVSKRWTAFRSDPRFKKIIENNEIQSIARNMFSIDC